MKAAAAALLGAEKKIWPEGHRSLQPGQAGHFSDDVARWQNVAVRRLWIGRDIVGLMHLRAEPTDGGDVIIVDRQQPGGIGVPSEELGPCREHGERHSSPPRLAQHRGAKKVVTQAERAEQQRPSRQTPARQLTGQARRARDEAKPAGLSSIHGRDATKFVSAWAVSSWRTRARRLNPAPIKMRCRSAGDFVSKNSFAASNTTTRRVAAARCVPTPRRIAGSAPSPSMIMAVGGGARPRSITAAAVGVATTKC